MAREKIGDPLELSLAARQDSMTLWGSDNPEEVINRASKVAKVLKRVVDSQKMFTMIGAGKHLRVEAWQTLGAMTGIFAVVAWTRKLDNGWEARVEARTKNGELVGAAESECLNTERNWSESKGKDDHALRSMAQTRATSKALSMPLRFIVALAGYEGTPAEEMPTDPRPSDSFRRPQQTVKAQETAGKADSKAPADKPAPKVEETSGNAWSGLVDKVTFRDYNKKDRQGNLTGEKGKIYSILTRDGKTFKTFSDTFASDCKFAAENDEPMAITFTTKEFRGVVEFDVVTCIPAALNDPEPTVVPDTDGPEREA